MFGLPAPGIEEPARLINSALVFRTVRNLTARPHLHLSEGGSLEGGYTALQRHGDSLLQIYLSACAVSVFSAVSFLACTYRH